MVATAKAVSLGMADRLACGNTSDKPEVYLLASGNTCKSSEGLAIGGSPGTKRKAKEEKEDVEKRPRLAFGSTGNETQHWLRRSMNHVDLAECIQQSKTRISAITPEGSAQFRLEY